MRVVDKLDPQLRHWSMQSTDNVISSLCIYPSTSLNLHSQPRSNIIALVYRYADPSLWNSLAYSRRSIGILNPLSRTI